MSLELLAGLVAAAAVLAAWPSASRWRVEARLGCAPRRLRQWPVAGRWPVAAVRWRGSRRGGRRGGRRGNSGGRGGDGQGPHVDLVMDLVAAALAAGSPPGAALTVVGELAGGSAGRAARQVGDTLALGAPWEDAWRLAPRELDAMREALWLAWRYGAPPAALLRSAADDVRRQRASEAGLRAARLGAHLLLPLGLCFLPAFVLLGVAPVVISLTGDLLSGVR